MSEQATVVFLQHYNDFDEDGQPVPRVPGENHDYPDAEAEALVQGRVARYLSDDDKAAPPTGGPVSTSPIIPAFGKPRDEDKSSG